MKSILCLVAFAAGLLLMQSPVCAQSSGRFSVTRNVIAGGGTTFSSSARFQLGSTIAQPLAAVPASARFSIQGGFWIWPAPIIYPATKVGTNFVFSFQADLGQSYVVQYINALSTPNSNWGTLTTVVGNGGVVTVTNPTSGSSAEFFRLLEQ